MANRHNHRSNYSSRRSSSTTTSDSFLSTRYLPSFSEQLSSSRTKRPSEAFYDHSVLGAHMVGHNEAWLSSDSLAKRPRLDTTTYLPVYPQRPGEKDCPHYMLTRTCKFGDTCKFDHPFWVPAGGIPDWKEPPALPSEPHPERPGEPDCTFFLKTQTCKFGIKCRFNHPKDKLGDSSRSDASDLPERPSEPLCSFYMRAGKCKFGHSCKFHHPKDVQIPSGGQELGKENKMSVEKVGTMSEVNMGQPLMSNPAISYNYKGFPIRVGEEDCPFFLKTGSCKYGANCRYNHPDKNVISPMAATIGHSTVGLVNPASPFLQSLQPGMDPQSFGLAPTVYPQRPGHDDCEFYMRTGVCKFRDSCRFHHPIDRSAAKVKLTLAGLPRREGAQPCPFYMKTSTCCYGVTCKFDHPPPGEVLASVTGKETTASKDEEEEEGEHKVDADEGKENGQESSKE